MMMICENQCHISIHLYAPDIDLPIQPNKPNHSDVIDYDKDEHSILNVIKQIVLKYHKETNTHRIMDRIQAATSEIKFFCHIWPSPVKSLCGIIRIQAQYGHRMDTLWKISTVHGMTIIIKFIKFSMMHSYECSINYLSITRLMAQTHVSTYCGRHPSWNESCRCSYIEMNLVVVWIYDEINIQIGYTISRPYSTHLHMTAESRSEQQIIGKFWPNTHIKFLFCVNLLISTSLRSLIQVVLNQKHVGATHIYNDIVLYDGPSTSNEILPGRISGAHIVLLTAFNEWSMAWI